MSLINFIQLKFVNVKSKRIAEAGREDQCKICKVINRPDIVHCTDCGVCVEGHDHHCGVVGLCIGDANFKYFVLWQVYGGLTFVAICVAQLVF